MKSESQESGANPVFDSLASFNGEPSVFWGKLSDYARGVFHAQAICLLVETSQGQDLRVLAQTPAGASRRMGGVSEELRAMVGSEAVVLTSVKSADMIGLILPSQEGAHIWLVADFERGGVPAEKKELQAAAKDVRVLAELFQTRRLEKRTQQKLLTLSEVLDIGLALGESQHFGEAALRVCNEVAAQMVATRVSLSWVDGEHLILQSTSHGGKISKESEEAKALERIMEESMDQDNEVAYPAIEGSTVITREHRSFSKAHDDVSVLSVPLRGAKGACGVLCLEKASEDGEWKAPELEKLRLMTDLFASRLDDLYDRTGWFGRRIWRRLRLWASGFLGPEHTGWKLAGVTGLLAFLFMAIVPMEHKVKAPFILKTDAAARITAPFPGYIDKVTYHLGDKAERGQLLVGLDQRELLLQQSDTVAGRNKSDREAKSYEAQGKLAEMLVSKAEKEQAEAKLAIIEHRLAQTQIGAPFDGIVVEGELREKLSAPVQVGETLFKIVQLRDLFGQLQVDERDVSYLKADFDGELAFSSRPGEKYSVTIDRFEPVAEVRSEGNIFLLRAQIHGEPQSWWRPGMSGICKINAGKRSILWIVSHRVVEVIRLWLWV